MQLERAQPSIVRSIRHVSLIKDWTRARRADTLPHFSDFVPDERSGDSADLVIAEVHRDGEDIAIYCRSAGARVEQLFGRVISGCYLRDVTDPNLAGTSRPVWRACITDGLPVCSILSLIDCNGCPVTMEQICLPYRSSGQHVEMIVSAVHAWSTEGRFAIQGLLSNLTSVPPRSAIVIDPDLATVADSTDQIEID